MLFKILWFGANATPAFSAARTLKFGRQAGADEYDDDYDNGASGYDAYWKNLAPGGQQDSYREEDDDEDEDYVEEDEEEEEEDDDDEEEEEGEGDEEKAAGSISGLKLGESAWVQKDNGVAATCGHVGSNCQVRCYPSGVFDAVEDEDDHSNQISILLLYIKSIKVESSRKYSQFISLINKMCCANSITACLF